MQFTFGKHRGRLIDDVVVSDFDYIKWLIYNRVNGDRFKNQIDYAERLAAPLFEREKEMNIQRVPLLQPVLNAMKTMMLVNKLKHGRETSQWTLSIFDSLSKGEKISPYAQELVADMCGKCLGRRNSNKYKNTKNNVEQAFQQAYNTALSCTQ